MSDLHGCYDKFIKMIELIEFDGIKDELYIIGDIFDRGHKSLEILDYIVSHKNIHLIKGNHEQLFEEYYESGDVSLWYLNGGVITHQQIIMRGGSYEERLYHFIKRLPLYKIVDNFLLVHAGVNINKYDKTLPLETILDDCDENMFLWDRSNIGNNFIYEDFKLIVGHTPVGTIVENTNEILVVNNNTYYIDCGAVFENGRLACLRLNDMKEFYVD